MGAGGEPDIRKADIGLRPVSVVVEIDLIGHGAAVDIDLYLRRPLICDVDEFYRVFAGLFDRKISVFDIVARGVEVGVKRARHGQTGIGIILMPVVAGRRPGPVLEFERYIVPFFGFFNECEFKFVDERFVICRGRAGAFHFDGMVAVGERNGAEIRLSRGPAAVVVEVDRRADLHVVHVELYRRRALVRDVDELNGVYSGFCNI